MNTQNIGFYFTRLRRSDFDWIFKDCLTQKTESIDPRISKNVMDLSRFERECSVETRTRRVKLTYLSTTRDVIRSIV